ncbi:Vesicle transport v-SNARE protein N-terminus, partial [Musa troglodytarum]
MSRPRAPPSQSQDLRLESNAITMSEVFDGYERQHCEISASLSRKCTSAALLDGDSKNESRSQKLAAEHKGQLLTKLREYKSDLNNLKSEFKRITIPNPSQAARGAAGELVITVVVTGPTLNKYIAAWNHCVGFESMQPWRLHVSADQRARLLVSNERLNKSSGKIKESIRTTLESEEVGVSVLQDLHQQVRMEVNNHQESGGPRRRAGGTANERVVALPSWGRNSLPPLEFLRRAAGGGGDLVAELVAAEMECLGRVNFAAISAHFDEWRFRRRKVAASGKQVCAAGGGVDSCVATGIEEFADEEDFIKAGGSERLFVQTQERNPTEKQSKIAKK